MKGMRRGQKAHARCKTKVQSQNSVFFYSSGAVKPTICQFYTTSKKFESFIILFANGDCPDR